MATQNSHATRGEQLEAVSKLTVTVFAQHIGRGPTKAKSWISQDLVLCLIEDTLTHGEQTLISTGHNSTVLSLRYAFQESMRTELITGIEDLIGHRVVTLLPSISLNPDITSELFLLDQRLKTKTTQPPTIT